MPDPEKIKNGDPEASQQAFKILQGYSKSQLFAIRRTMNNWGWHPLLGVPPEKWEELPNYKKPWMPDSTVTKSDYIRPYVAMLSVLGVTHHITCNL